jgi:restriction system protein
LLQRVKKASPVFFERLVVELLLTMGYGGSRREAGEAIGKAGDEGIDGIINEDRLGLDVIYLQAKRWEGSVGRPEIQKFVGALHGKRAKKGVFMTTGSFSADAREYVAHIDPKVVLIDGEQLSQLMIDWNVGVSRVATYETKQIDSDYFEG